MPAGGPPFIDHEVFRELITHVPNTHGEAYQDIDTIYRDMSRFVVVYFANTDPSEIRQRYNELGWGGEANVRAICECAKAWLAEYHPELLPVTT